MREKAEHRLANRAIIALFLLAITTPLAVSIVVKDPEVSHTEKRLLAEAPAFPKTAKELWHFPRRFEEYYNDHFGFRQQLGRWFGYCMVKLGASPSDKVVVGKDGWFFYAAREERLIEDYRNIDLLPPAILESWGTHLAEKHRWLSDRNIPYLFVVAPNKHTIYSEHYPARFRRAGKISRYDQVVEYVKANTEVPILDLREALFAAKERAQLYHKGDTHWNTIGAGIAQYEVARAVSASVPSIVPVFFSPEEFTWQEGFSGDLVTMMGLRDMVTEKKPVLPGSLNRNRYLEKKDDRTIVTQPGNADIEALILGDSFSQAMRQYYTQYFNRTVFVWDHVDIPRFKKYVEEEDPDIVIEERVERSLWSVDMAKVTLSGAASEE